jgi:NAD(P)-dependent dehydrogenase (short-subunit alcohol dehydrogenase family)
MTRVEEGKGTMGQLDGKVAIVTGATSGIGERIAEVFVDEGACVVAAGRREAEGLALESRCGPSLSFVRTDVTDEASVKAMVDHAVMRFGRLDCLVNNAGTGAPMVSITEVTSEQFSAVFDTNVRGVMFGIKHAAGIMLGQGSGSIITIASAAGHRGGISGHVYSASKAAVIHLSRSAAAELSSKGVRVNTISPGGIVTGIFAKASGVEGAEADRMLGVISDLFATAQAIPRAGATSDIAHAAVFLASDVASFVTGQDLTVDGGLVPFGKFGWADSVEFRAEIARRIKRPA